MISLSEIYVLFVKKLSNIYGEREASNLFYWTIEILWGISRIAYAMDKNKKLSDNQQELLYNILQGLEKKEPIQYVLNTAYCRELKFYVDKNVLIPRSETEELIALIVDKYRKKKSKILDIGTGSACIAISLKKELENSDIMAIDISEEALQVAKKNAKDLQVSLKFERIDILNREKWDFVTDSALDIVVSNPPYVRNSEKEQMQTNVLDYEPEQALFVTDENPLLFYDAIADFSLRKLKENGVLFFEINEFLAKDLQSLLEKKGYREIKIIQDIHEKNRFASAIK